MVGSGKLGQSYLFWQGDRLYELPVSYFSESGAWVNSPGYLDGTANFARPAGARCLECHSTWFQVVEPPNRYDRGHFLLGVSCERCHGPAADHVAYHRGNEAPGDTIVSPAALSRERQLDLCSQCHSGTGRPVQPAFSYRPGEPLERFLEILYDGTDGPGGVHSANQRARLALSRCFERSEMTCTTCHDVHRPERDQPLLFAQRCLSCHDSRECGVVRAEGERATSRCIDCHMPKEPDHKTAMQTSGESIFPMLRDHFIRVEPEAARRVLGEGLSR